MVPVPGLSSFTILLFAELFHRLSSVFVSRILLLLIWKWDVVLISIYNCGAYHRSIDSFYACISWHSYPLPLLKRFNMFLSLDSLSSATVRSRVKVRYCYLFIQIISVVITLLFFYYSLLPPVQENYWVDHVIGDPVLRRTLFIATHSKLLSFLWEILFSWTLFVPLCDFYLFCRMPLWEFSKFVFSLVTAT